MSRNAGSVHSLTWTNTGVATDVAPDTDTAIQAAPAASIIIQVDSTHASNTSTDIDINVMASLDGTNYDNTPYATVNIGDNIVKSFSVTPGPYYIKLRLDNNAAATTAYVTARILLIAD